VTPHLRIRASAGTGKTFRLTDRIIELLLYGADPRKIIALTFTRKSAGEFLNKTLRKLAECASDKNAAAAFCARRSISPQRQPPDFLKLLRDLTRSLDRIEFGTIDSFFFRVVTAFGTELGLGPALRLQNPATKESDDLEVRRELARRLDAEALVQELLRVPGRAKVDPLGGEFELLADIERLHTLYPEPAAWGNARQIWGGPCPWERFDGLDPVVPKDCNEQIAKAIREFLNYGRDGKLNAAAKRLLEKAHKLLRGEPVEIEFNRKTFAVPPGSSAAARDAMGVCIWRVLKANLAAARRWHGIGVALAAVRDERMRTGLRFEDLAVLVGRLPKLDSGQLQFRLDGWFDHWLIDEFQDTSRIQWRALEPLVDEVLQDSSGTRSFFYVGDVKQSIYSFRDGDPTLFEEIFRRYTSNNPGHIVDEPIGESYRSAKEVIAFIQRAFEPAALARGEIEPDVVERWRTAWTDHSANKGNPAPGRTIHVTITKDDCWEKVANVIRESAVLDDPDRTCAVLVRKNDDAQWAVRELGARGIPASTESKPLIAQESPVGVAVLMAARLVADPTDAFARRALAMGPIGELGGDFVNESLRALHLGGALTMVSGWLRMMRRPETEACLEAARPELLRRAAAEFDSQGGSGPRAFAEFFAGYEIPSAARPGTVQVLTIHKSKGLEYDLVFLPVLNDERIDKRDGAAIFCGDSRNLGPGTKPWIMALPGEDLGVADPHLERAGQALRDRSTFDNLCTLYVAATRARRGLVILTLN
jgi:ATP-dependent helicase/nuclease subunit A